MHLSSPGLLLLQPARPGMVSVLQPGWVSARYGHKQAAPALQSSVRACNADFDTLLWPWQLEPPEVQLELIAAQADGAALDAPPQALRITLQEDGERVVDHWFHARGCNAARWRVGQFEFSARWVFWREDAHGRLLHATSHEGAVLSGGTQAGAGIYRSSAASKAPDAAQRAEIAR